MFTKKEMKFGIAGLIAGVAGTVLIEQYVLPPQNNIDSAVVNPTNHMIRVNLSNGSGKITGVYLTESPFKSEPLDYALKEKMQKDNVKLYRSSD